MQEAARQRLKSCATSAMTWSSWTGICRGWAESKPVVQFGSIQTWGSSCLLFERLKRSRSKLCIPVVLARVRANLRRAPWATRQGSNLITFDQVQVDLDTHHVSIQGRDVRLTPKQFEVLNYLIANPNVSIPHAKILQAVWGPDYGGEVEYLHVLGRVHTNRRASTINAK